MAVLFVSHSSKDDAYASALESWLNANGFTDIFVDHESIAGGDKWRDALRAASGACRVILCLVTENWLASSECFGEFEAGWYLSKRIIPLFLLPPSASLGSEAKSRLGRVCGEDQGIDLLPCLTAQNTLDIGATQSVAARLETGLRAAGANTRVGFDPEAFAIDRKLRPTPFPGLAAFSDYDADAALFYGRSSDIQRVLEELRAIRHAGRDPCERRAFVILGASGAGKSSLLKAGIIPRLRRETPAFLPLRAFRPGADPMLNFAQALSRTLEDYGRREAIGVIRDRLFAAWSRAAHDANGALTNSGFSVLDEALDAEGRLLREASGCAGATILISADQAEEMARAEGKSAEALAEYLRVALDTTRSPWQLALTIRIDSFSELGKHRRFQEFATKPYDLRAVPVFAFKDVIEEPARRYGVSVDHLLIEAVMEEAPKEDALPLLAFALERLWQQWANTGALTHAHYDKIGRLKGLIEDAAERALRGIEPSQDVPLPSGPPPKHQTDLAVSTFVPALVEINDQGTTIRHIAKWADFEDPQQELLNRFDRWRLVIRKGEVGGGTVEVAHEALFRTWERLAGWLEPERAKLEALRSLQVDSGNWERNGGALGYLHREGVRGPRRSTGRVGRTDRLTRVQFLAASGV
jgi:TIR domain